MDPREIVQAAIDAYHARDLDRWLGYYAPDVVVRDGAGTTLMDGAEAVRSRYAKAMALVTPSAYHSTMPLNIKDPETERLASEVAALTGESKTGAVRTALRERRERLELQRAVGDRQAALRALLEREVWPSLPAGAFGRAPSQAEQDEILGYGESGV